MSIACRQGYQLGANALRKVKHSTKLFKEISTAYSVKLEEYDPICSELASATDNGLHDS